MQATLVTWQSARFLNESDPNRRLGRLPYQQTYAARFTISN
jgi:hypothetical protein